VIGLDGLHPVNCAQETARENESATDLVRTRYARNDNGSERAVDETTELRAGRDDDDDYDES